MERKLVAIFSTDVAGYSRLMGDDEEATVRTLKAYRVVITDLIEQHHGRVVDSPGDNMLAEFASAVDAVKAAVAVQCALKTRNAQLEGVWKRGLSPFCDTSSEPFKHETAHGGIDEGFAGGGEIFIIFAHAAIAPQPSKRPFDHPAPR